MAKTFKILSGVFFLLLAQTAFLFPAKADDLYKEFQPKETTRDRESIEWSVFYSYETNNNDLPRALLIGDSICSGYQAIVNEKLAGKINVSSWASSKCVTDPNYFKELDLILSAGHYDFITFNNALHSFNTNRQEWEYAYRQAIKFIRAQTPDTQIFIVTPTPLEDPNASSISKGLADESVKIAEEYQLPVIDLYSITDQMDHAGLWADGIHFNDPGKETHAKTIAEMLLKAWEEKSAQ